VQSKKERETTKINEMDAMIIEDLEERVQMEAV